MFPATSLPSTPRRGLRQTRLHTVIWICSRGNRREAGRTHGGAVSLALAWPRFSVPFRHGQTGELLVHYAIMFERCSSSHDRHRTRVARYVMHELLAVFTSLSLPRLGSRQPDQYPPGRVCLGFPHLDGQHFTIWPLFALPTSCWLPSRWRLRPLS